jgi:hypothetical protein
MIGWTVRLQLAGATRSDLHCNQTVTIRAYQDENYDTGRNARAVRKRPELLKKRLFSGFGKEPVGFLQNLHPRFKSGRRLHFFQQLAGGTGRWGARLLVLAPFAVDRPAPEIVGVSPADTLEA